MEQDSSRRNDSNRHGRTTQRAFPIEASIGGIDDNIDRFSNFSEAEEAPLIEEDEVLENEGGDDDDDGEDLFDESMLRDYGDNAEEGPGDNQYDPALLDDETQIPNMRPSDRRRVERLLDARDRLEEGQQQTTRRHESRTYQGLRDLMITDEEEEEEDEVWRILRERRERLREGADRAGTFPVQQAEQAKDELPYCTGKGAWTERVAEILEVVFTGFLSLYTRPNVNQIGFNLSNTSNDEGTQREQTSQTSITTTGESTYLGKIDEMVHRKILRISSLYKLKLCFAEEAPHHEGFMVSLLLMFAGDSTSLIVAWEDLRHYCPKVLEWLYQIPLNTLSILDLSITQIAQQKYQKLYSKSRITARLRGYDAVDSLRTLNTEYLNNLISIRGVVLRKTVIQPRLRSVWYRCGRCLCDTNGPYEKRDDEKMNKRRIKIVCEVCQGTGPFSECREKNVYENYQRLTIQEPPSQVLPGYVPKQKQVIVLGDLVDTMRPGDEVVLTGIYQTTPDARLNAKAGFPVFGTQIIANNIEKQKEVQMTELTDTDLEIIHKLSKNKFIREKIIDSIAPSIWGHRHIKTGLAYSMLGGVPRHSSDGHSIRGDINFLILGDPGVGKSQFLKYVEKTFDRTIFTTGKGSTAVGLTAAIRRDESNGEWYLEGGALVLADQGICLIDEFDKMADQDRVSIHEAMEQQSISISKAGIVTTLKARCSIIAAANPILGRYDTALTFSENVDLGDPILSRFDILAVVKDQVHPVIDEQLAEHVVTTHANPTESSNQFRLTGRDPSDPDGDENLIDVNAEWVTGTGRIPQPILRKYILYARRNCFPEMKSTDESMLAQFYSEIRQVSLSGGGIPMTVRHLESVMRMACANARMRLSPYVDKRDMNYAISTMVESFIQSQKYAVATQLGKRFGRYRALAASPEEFIENVLMETLSRNTSKLLHGRRTDDQSDPMILQNIIYQAVVGLTQLVMLAKTMYNLPETAVSHYCHSERFKNYFTIEERHNEQGEKQKYIRRAPENQSVNDQQNNNETGTNDRSTTRQRSRRSRR